MAEEPASPIAFGPFQLLRRERRIVGPSGPVSLSNRAFEILLVLLDSPDRLVTKAELLDRVWQGLAVEENNLQVHISALRKVLGRERISTVSGRGYKYVGERPAEIAHEHEARSPGRESGVAFAERGNLPRPLSAMIGREESLAELLGATQKARAVTVVGLGGVGKTRLAIEAAHQLAGSFVDGAWFVDLSPVQDGSQVLGTIAKTLGIPVTGVDENGTSGLALELADKSILLLLDNCEHLIEPVAVAAEALLQAGPGVRILATSREPLEISGEGLVHLNPLECPPTDEDDPALIGSKSAVRLFTDRLGTSRAAMDRLSSTIIADICRTLDGIPLAIEMAASRASSIGLEALAAGLHSRLRLEMTGRRTAIPRHRTLQATLDWSANLLTPLEQTLLHRLAIFPGYFDIPAVLYICTKEETQEWEIAELLGGLVRKSLVASGNIIGGRFRLLNTVRAYAAEKLKASGEAPDLHLRHAQWTQRSLESGLAEWEHLSDRVWLDRHGPSLDDCRAALRWADMAGQEEVHAILAALSFRLWIQVGIPQEGLGGAQTALQRLPASASSTLQIQLRIAIAEMAAFCAMQSLALQTIAPALPACRNLADPYLLTIALTRAGFALWCQQKHGEAIAHYREAAEALKVLETPKLLAWATMATGLGRCATGDLAAGRSMCETALKMHRAAGEETGYRRSLLFFAECLFHCGDNETAISHGQELVRLFGGLGRSRYLGYALSNLAAYLLQEDRTGEAEACLVRAHDTILREGGTWLLCLVQNFALLAAQKGDPVLAARLLGYVDRKFSENADSRQRTEEIARERLFSLLEEMLPASTFSSLRSDGAIFSQWQVEALITGIMADSTPDCT